ncbi:RING-H2 finger protein ATL78-like [Prosopis cineraria]|uniref:RING-H2 finger protein ATL78-like n=1 Tax=Prosopis cineraria TaxID=364024 RepID=UPI00240EB53D|nr:RING-H2 finger protein ATL78-like [Prosopis cineraria]
MSGISDHQFFFADGMLIHSRRLLFLHSHLNSSKTNSTDPSFLGDGNFDANVIMVLSVLLCALICSLGLNSIIRCALRFSNIVVNDPAAAAAATNSPARLANTGVKKKALKTFPTVTYSIELKLPGPDTECAICLSEFNSGDRLRILPKCNHGYHLRCIDKWLGSHSSCPKCRRCLLQTCHKIVDSSTTSQPSSAETIVRISPLEPEAMVRNYT